MELTPAPPNDKPANEIIPSVLRHRVTWTTLGLNSLEAVFEVYKPRQIRARSGKVSSGIRTTLLCMFETQGDAISTFNIAFADLSRYRAIWAIEVMHCACHAQQI